MLNVRRQIFAIVALSVVVFNFQNCSEMQFSEESGKIVALDTNDYGDGSDILPPPAEDEGVPPGEVVPPKEEVPPVVVNDDDKDCKDKNHEHDKKEHAKEPKYDGELVYHCILDGPGKSVRAGYINEALGNNGRTPDSICTSKAGCELIGEYLPVKEISVSGTCKNNPHVIHLTLQQINSLVNKAK